MNEAAVFFLPHDVNSLLDGVSSERIDEDLNQYLSDLAPRLIAERQEHRHFGPYWWWIKPMLKNVPGTRRGWVRGGYQDRTFLAQLAGRRDDPDDAVAPLGSIEQADPAAVTEQNRRIAWLGLRYYEAELVDDIPAEFHIVETAGHHVFAYQLYDADASRQMDLFAGEEEPSAEVQQLLRDPVRFSGTAWLRRADELDAQGEPWRAAAALRRSIGRSIDPTDRSRAWLRLGQLFQDQNHVHKAIFCYRNAFERDQEGWVQGLMADAWEQAGEPHEALRCYRRALEAMPGNPEYQAGMARAEHAIRREGRQAAGYTLLQERLAR
jgi:tetratricopeptide (TPR) repeat protein